MNKKYLFGFAFYDFANSGYVLIMLSFLFPIFFKETIFQSARNAEFWWGLVISLSVTIAILIGPIAGHRSDRGNRKRVFSTMIAGAILGVILLAMLPQISISVYFMLFLLTNVLFVLSQIIYDSFLPQIAPKGEASIVSTFSWGFGYLGGLVCLGIVLAVQAGSTEPSVAGIYATAIFFAIFSFISLKLLPSQPAQSAMAISFRQAVKEAKIKHFLMPLMAIWFITGGIYIIVFFGSLYARETLSVGIKELGIFLLTIQLVAFPATWMFGKIGKKYGVLRALYITIGIWVVIVLGIIIVENIAQLAVVATLGALVIGSTQSLLRAFYTQLATSKYAGLDFGFYSLVARSSAAVGPVLFGSVVALSDSPKIAMLVTMPSFLIGAYLLWKYNKKQKAMTVGPSLINK